MRKSILAIAAVGTVFALTAAGASSLTVNAGTVPATGATAASTCSSATVTASYTASSADPSKLYSVDLVNSGSGVCLSYPALVKVTYGNTPTTIYGYVSGGIGSPTVATSVTNFYSDPAYAVSPATHSAVTLPDVADFTSVTVGATIAGAFN